jgi:hypothetical protein
LPETNPKTRSGSNNNAEVRSGFEINDRVGSGPGINDKARSGSEINDEAGTGSEIRIWSGKKTFQIHNTEKRENGYRTNAGKNRRKAGKKQKKRCTLGDPTSPKIERMKYSYRTKILCQSRGIKLSEATRRNLKKYLSKEAARK